VIQKKINRRSSPPTTLVPNGNTTQHRSSSSCDKLESIQETSKSTPKSKPNVFLLFNNDNLDTVTEKSKEISNKTEYTVSDCSASNIMKTINESKVVVVFLSPEFLNSSDNCKVVEIAASWKKNIISVILSKLPENNMYPPAHPIAMQLPCNCIDFTKQFNSKELHQNIITMLK